MSGGPDSLGLLLLAAASRPGAVEAATVDHGLRAESRAEAEMVARVCERLSVPHAVLSLSLKPPNSNLQAWARKARYGLLEQWARERGLGAIATAHHVDDQAETLLMRVARGSGVAGLAGVHRKRFIPGGNRGGIAVVRPLLDWRRAELRRIVEDCGLQPVQDPSNEDERFDRSRVRSLLQKVDWLDPNRLASVAGHARDCEEALDWAARQEMERRLQRDGNSMSLDPQGLPRELKRRMLVGAIAMLTGETPPGPKLIAAMETLESGGTTTLAGLKLEGGTCWRLSPAPPRKRLAP